MGVDINTDRCRVGQFVPHNGADDISRQFVPHHGAGKATRKFVPHHGVDCPTKKFVPHHGTDNLSRKFAPHHGTDDLSRKFVPHHGAGDATREFVPHDGTDDLSRQFAPHHGTGGMCISNFSLLTCMVGALFFIGMILLMAGIEPNPGPQDTFLFRYQYLLIDIGAKVLRGIFEVQVGRDFVNYLATNNTASGTLKYLMTGKNRKITPDQEKLLPPMEKNPTSSAYDITLLSLLLRNICGLCPAGDPVWMNPLPTDHRVEADITRLRKCRNEMMHIDTLHISEKDLKVKWQELEQILNRLNNTAGLANLSKMINDAKHMDIDFELRERYLHTIKSWAVMDCAMNELNTRVGTVESAQKDTTRQHSELDTRVGAVETAQQDTTRQHSELDTRVLAVETAQQDTSRQHSELDTRVVAVETAEQNTTRQHSELNKRVGAVETAQQDTSRQYSVAMSVMKRELDTRVGAVETAQQNTTRQHSEINKRVGAVETAEQDTTRQNSELDTRVGAVETAQQDTMRQHSELDTRVGAVETAQQETTRQHSELDTRVGAVETSQQDTTRQHSELDTRVGAVETAQQDTSRQYSELDTRVEAGATAQQGITRQHSADISAIKRDHSELDTRVVTLEKMQQPSGQNHSVGFKDIQNQLIGIYKRRCMTLPVSPVFTNRDDNLLNIYKYPTMYSVQRNRAESDKKKEITSYEGMFCKDGQVFADIYLTGDAGVGKTAFCTCMSLLWCYVKSGVPLADEYPSLQKDKKYRSAFCKLCTCMSLSWCYVKNDILEDGEYPPLQKDMEYMSKFEFLFYVSLRDTCHINVVDMIIEQLFRNNKDRYQSIIENILSEKSSLILMDGLDEWMPSQLASKKSCKLPDRINSNTCVYITTSRPHRLESVRLSSKDVDHHIELMGLSGDSSKSYVENVVKYLNEANSKDENVSSFIKDVKQCNLNDLLSIPIIASHLVVLWFEGTISNMPRALIYANILEMLFKRAEQRGVGFISSTESKFQHIPAFVSGMNNLNKHLSLLYNVCHLSFRSLFQSDEKVPNLVFTVDQLVDEPYCFTVTEIDFLCHIGVLSKNEVFGCYSVEKLKLSYIHKSYLEFFAALYISSCDTSDLFDDRWKSINNVLQSKNMILLLVGMSHDGGKQLFDTLYQLLSDELSLCRTKAIFHYDDYERYSYQRQIRSLQDLIIQCFRELDRSSHLNIVLRLDDYIVGDSYNDVLMSYSVLNAPNVKSIHSRYGKYYVEFDKITNLQCLHVGGFVYDVKFSELMIQNHSTLHTVCIEGYLYFRTLLPGLPVRSLHHLTSLSLCHETMKHAHLLDILSYLSDNVLMENIKLEYVYCDDHMYSTSYRCTLNLPHHTKLVTLYLIGKNIECKNINTSCIKSITTDMIDIDLLHYIQHSKLEHLQIHSGCGLRYNLSDYTSTVRTLTAVVKTLPCIRSLKLYGITFPQDAILEIHPEVTTVKIKLYDVTMSRQWFHCFIQSCVNKKSVIQVKLYRCEIISDDEEPYRQQSGEESVDYMYQHLTSIQTVNITWKDGNHLYFETRCQ